MKRTQGFLFSYDNVLLYNGSIALSGFLNLMMGITKIKDMC